MKRFILFLFAYYSLVAHAQNEPLVEEIVEKYLENIETESDYTQILEELQLFTKKPLNLNHASVEALLDFPLFSPSGALAIVNHRNKFGPFIHIYELQVVGFSAAEINQILPYISINKNAEDVKNDLKNVLYTGHIFSSITTKRKQPLVLPDSLLGDHAGIAIRMRYSNPGNYSIGFSLEKDAGEAYWKKGPDFYSAHCFIENKGRIKALVLGDYLLSFGQGLVMGSGIGMSKSALVLNTRRNAPTLKPYRGMNEYLFLRGAAATVAIKKLEITLAAARNSLDTRVQIDSLDNFEFKSTDLDGLHRNENEWRTKYNNQRNMTGIWTRYVGKRGYWGAGANHFTYSIPLAAQTDIYRKFDPYGKSQSFIHFFQAQTWKRYYIFSEWAVLPQNRSHAAIAGLMTAFGTNLETSLLWRKYSPGFLSPFSTAFGNRSANETGFYLGLKLKMGPKLSLSHYTDLYRNMWLNYRLWSPANGQDQLWQLDFIPAKKHLIYLRFREQHKPYPLNDQIPVKYLSQLHTKQLRFHVRAPLNKNTQWQVRSETGAAYTPQNTYFSSLVFIHVSSMIKKTQITMRYNVFNVPFYDQRIYAFETQLPNEFGTTAFYGKGYSWFAIIQQKIKYHWKVGMRCQWQQYIAPDENQITNKSSLFFQLTYD